MMPVNPYNTDLDSNPANHQPLTSLTFLERAATVFPDHMAIIHGALRRNYAFFYARSAVVNDWQEGWSFLPNDEQASLKSRQGVR